MSTSLKIRDGDLALEGVRLATVTGSAKMVQDLRLAILERMGTDDAHQWFGSLIDGGTLNGIEQPSLISTSDWSRTIALVDSEVRRIVAQYQGQQLIRSENDRLVYGTPTLSSDELLLGVSNIEYIRSQDVLVVRITLRTGSNTPVTINVPVE